jgi:hypothetical protein
MALRLAVKCQYDPPFYSVVNTMPLGPFTYVSDILFHYFIDIDEVYPYLRIRVHPEMRVISCISGLHPVSLHVHSPLRPARWWHILLEVPADGDGLHLLKLFFFLNGLGPLAFVHSELMNSDTWNLQTVGKTPWTGDQPCRKAATYTEHNHWINGEIHAWMGFEPRIPVLERAKTFLAPDRTVTVNGLCRMCI